MLGRPGFDSLSGDLPYVNPLLFAVHRTNNNNNNNPHYTLTLETSI